MTDRIAPGVDVDLAAGLILIDLDTIIQGAGLLPDLPKRYSLAHDILEGMRRWKDDHALPVTVTLMAAVHREGGDHV